MTYHVTVSREAGYWVAEVLGLRGGATEARRLSALDTEVRDLVSGLTDVEPEQLDLHWDMSPALRDADKAVYAVSEARHELEAAHRRYDDAVREAARSLAAEDVSLRDSATLLDLSHQRIHQLLQEETR